MGRKPNQLILEFFERGPKLEDASNRYQHTCKSCGEKFPKGRIDSLTNHLVKKCPALPLRDRQRAILQFHELPDLPENIANLANTAGQPQSGQTLNLPFAPKQGMSALETLAEVSRQHLDLSGKRGSGKARRKSSPRSSALHHGALLDEFLVQDERPDGTDPGGMTDRPDWVDVSGAPPLPSIFHYGQLQHSPAGSPHLGNMPMSSSSSMAQMVPSLVMAASAANELQSMMPTNGMSLDPDLGLPHTSMSDKYFHSDPKYPPWSTSQVNIDPLLHNTIREQSVPKDDFSNNKNAASFPRPIAMNPNTTHGTHFTTDFSMNQKPSKPKVRGRFSDSRRKEVQEVRKRGACIRCRMLKKPCSGESPCSTCVNVESARLWKQPCIRTRIAEEFGLYSAGLHGVLAFHAVSQAKGLVQLNQIPGRIEATHHPQLSTFATFTPLKCQRSSGSSIDPVLLGQNALTPEHLINLEILDSDTDDICGKLEQYIRKLGPTFYATESSPFMKSTLLTALNMTSASKDALLGRVLELWIATKILSDQSLEWHIFSNPSLPPAMAASIMSQSDLENGSRMRITSVRNRESYELIKTQLMAAIEKRAASLSKTVMNDIEKRLLQRQQANPFETFLVAVILLACVERMCWLFRAWEGRTSLPAPASTTHSDPNGTNPSDGSVAQDLQSTPSLSDFLSSASRNAKWPLDKQPAYYSQQGERFSDILFMLLKMRGIPPKTAPRQDGVLGVWGEDADAAAKEWYEQICITSETIAERANARFEGKDAREWELKYGSKIIAG